MSNNVRKSKIYTYFHGANNVFQQFLIAVGILCILLGLSSGQARMIKAENTYEKYKKLNTIAEEAKNTYDTLYNDYSTNDLYNFNCERYEEVKIVENDKNLNEKTAYNKALKEYNDAVEKAEKSKVGVLKKEATKLKEKCESIYSTYYWRLDCEKFKAAKISKNDWYKDEKTAYNKALSAYAKAAKKAKQAAEKDTEYAALLTKIEELKGAYNKLYNEYKDDAKYNFVCTQYEEAEILENDKYAEEKETLNKSLKEYNKANEKAEKKLEKYNRLNSSESLGSVLLPIAGVIAIVVGIIWSVIKKFVFDKKACEKAYDEEIQIKIEEAKEKALEKLNIVAEQIDKVEPVVLNGIATYESTVGKKSIAGAFSQGFADLFSSIEWIIVGALAAGLYSGVSLIFSGAFFIPVVIAIALVVFFGIKVHNKFEKDLHVNPKKIQRLEKLYPRLWVKLGTDDNVRVSLPAITVYMFGDEQIYMYYQYFDIVTGKIFCEGIHEYFYEDIVGVISSQETKKLFKRTGFLKLSIKVIDYLKENITVVSSGCQHSESYIVPVGKSLLDTSFVGMRNLIRQKKTDNE